MRLGVVGVLTLVTTLSASGQTFTGIGSGLPSGYCAEKGAAWGDYDNDGDLDLAIAGAGDALIYKNMGGTTFTPVEIDPSLPSLNDPRLAWGDYDNDGDLDLAIVGSYAYIYRNNGGDSFEDIGAGFSPVWPFPCLAWGDYDNDGDLDLAMGGGGGGNYKTRVYKNEGEDTFTDIGAGMKGVCMCSLAWGDFDNDQDLDLAVAGEATGSGNPLWIYENQGDDLFSAIPAGLPGNIRCCLAWGDYDSDGNLDLAISGNPSEIYRNNGDGTFTAVGAGLPNMQNEGHYSSLAWGDYDNDGDLDIAVAGWIRNYNMEGIQTRVYENIDSATFVLDATLPAGHCCSVAWGDYDNDADLDLVIVSDATADIFENNGGASNTNPSAPGGLAASATDTGILLNWSVASDSQTSATGLSYNMHVGSSTSEENVFCAMADLSSGWRRIPTLGNAQMGSSWIVDVTPGTYYCRVQAVDTAFAGSPWSPVLAFGPNIEVTPLGTIAFGSWDVDAGPTTVQSATITSVGVFRLAFTGDGITLTGTDADQFSIMNSPSTDDLLPGNSRVVEIAFDPSTPGEKSAFLTITTDDADDPSVNVELTGTAIGSWIIEWHLF